MAKTLWIKTPIDVPKYRHFYPSLIRRKFHLDLRCAARFLCFRQIQHVHRDLLMVRRQVRIALRHFDVGVAEELGNCEGVDAFPDWTIDRTAEFR